MNFEFSEEQQFIRDQAANFLREQCPPSVVREVLDTDKLYHEALWQSVVELGWTAMAIPENYGGLGLGYLELCVIAEEIGRVAAPIPFSSSVYLASEAILLAANEEQKQQYLPQLASGELIGTLASSETIGELEVHCQFVDGQLTGKKIAVADGQAADIGIVLAKDAQDSLVLCLADLRDNSVARQTVQTMDPSRPQADITFVATPAVVLGSASEAAKHYQTLLNKAAVLFAFEQIGGAQAAIAMGVEYTKNRFAFGRQVASFQAIKHKFADMYIALELARSNAFYGAWALATNATELPLAAATARVSASDSFFQISKENIQAHGGMGFTWEFDCHLYYRRAQYLSLIIGSNREWRERLASQLVTLENIA